MWDPPVLIPNTEVKPHRADGTVRDTVWESRTLPHFIERVRADSPDFFLCFQPHASRTPAAQPFAARSRGLALAAADKVLTTGVTQSIIFIENAAHIVYARRAYEIFQSEGNGS